MPRPSRHIPGGRLLVGMTLAVMISMQATSTQAGPIANSFQKWSSQRQSHARVEKPFSGQSGRVDINGPSTLQKLKNRLSFSSKANASGHQMKTVQLHHN